MLQPAAGDTVELYYCAVATRLVGRRVSCRLVLTGMRPGVVTTAILLALVHAAAASCSGSGSGYGCGSCVGCISCASDGSCGSAGCLPGYTAVANGGTGDPTRGVVDSNCAGFIVSGQVECVCALSELLCRPRRMSTTARCVSAAVRPQYQQQRVQQCVPLSMLRCCD